MRWGRPQRWHLPSARSKRTWLPSSRECGGSSGRSSGRIGIAMLTMLIRLVREKPRGGDVGVTCGRVTLPLREKCGAADIPHPNARRTWASTTCLSRRQFKLRSAARASYHRPFRGKTQGDRWSPVSYRAARLPPLPARLCVAASSSPSPAFTLSSPSLEQSLLGADTDIQDVYWCRWGRCGGWGGIAGAGTAGVGIPIITPGAAAGGGRGDIAVTGRAKIAKRYPRGVDALCVGLEGRADPAARRLGFRFELPRYGPGLSELPRHRLHPNVSLEPVHEEGRDQPNCRTRSRKSNFALAPAVPNDRAPTLDAGKLGREGVDRQLRHGPIQVVREQPSSRATSAENRRRAAMRLRAQCVSTASVVCATARPNCSSTAQRSGIRGWRPATLGIYSTRVVAELDQAAYDRPEPRCHRTADLAV